MEKQNLQTGEIWRQNLNSSTRSRRKNKSENEIEIWIEKDGFKPGVTLEN